MQESYRQAWEKIQNARYILIITHINPDADTISSALALSNFFFSKNIKHKVFNSSKKLPMNLDFLERFDKITDQIPNSYDLAIALDCGAKNRFGFDIDESVPLINIDHHASNNGFGAINIVDEHSASTAELVYRFFRTNELKISKAVAYSLYVGIYDDTLAFSTIRCDKSTFEAVYDLIDLGADAGYIADKLTRRDSLAKYRLLPKVLESLELHREGRVATIVLDPLWLKQTGASSNDSEAALDMVLNIAVVDIAVFLRISKNKIRVSLRSKNNIDVSVIADEFGGGGHKMAAGCTLDITDIDLAKNMILEKIN